MQSRSVWSRGAGAATLRPVPVSTWHVSGSYFEACNCDAICPCRTVGTRPGGRSTHGLCQFALSWHVLDGHADDVSLDGSSYQVLTAPEQLGAVREALEAAGFTIESSELTMLPKTTVEVADEGDAKKVLRLMDQLEVNDDVQEVFANFDIPELVLEAVAG